MFAASENLPEFVRFLFNLFKSSVGGLTLEVRKRLEEQKQELEHRNTTIQAL